MFWAVETSQPELRCSPPTGPEVSPGAASEVSLGGWGRVCEASGVNRWINGLLLVYWGEYHDSIWFMNSHGWWSFFSSNIDEGFHDAMTWATPSHGWGGSSVMAGSLDLDPSPTAIHWFAWQRRRSVSPWFGDLHDLAGGGFILMLCDGLDHHVYIRFYQRTCLGHLFNRYVELPGLFHTNGGTWACLHFGNIFSAEFLLRSALWGQTCVSVRKHADFLVHTSGGRKHSLVWTQHQSFPRYHW